MAKAQPAKKSPLLKWMIIGAGVVIAYLFFTQPDNSPASVANKSTAKKPPAGAQAFLPADYAAEEKPFPALKTSLTDAFKPDVVHGTGETSASEIGAGWTYSGMASVNGVGEAVLVNSGTGDTEILKRGQTWQSLRVANFTPDQITLEGPKGPLIVQVDTKDTEKSAPGTATAAVSPLPGPMGMQMPLTGDIGTGDLSVVQDNSGNRRGRGRRQRGMNADN